MTERGPWARHEWLAQVQEEVVDPGREIVDPHHHLWDRADIGSYLLDDLRADTGSGHAVTATVFVECHASYLADGPEHLRPVGETAFVAAIAAESSASEGAEIAGIVAHADLRLDGERLGEVLDAHADVGGGRFRGIRHAGARDEHRRRSPSPARRRPASTPTRVPGGVAALGERGLTYDTWHYHHQNADFAALAQAVPGTTMVLDHFGTPLGVGPYEGRRDEIFAGWKDDIAAIAEHANVVAKLGGLAMPDNGFGWHLAERPPTSDELVAAQGRYYHHALECFGPDRCMFESNFPVDRWSLSYPVLYNAFKKMVAERPDAEQDALFAGTARRVYRL
jgi:predicted TIM-barrel fold metal-dependent hydrolase